MTVANSDAMAAAAKRRLDDLSAHDRAAVLDVINRTRALSEPAFAAWRADFWAAYARTNERTGFKPVAA